MTAVDYDLEFREDGRVIELISIGMVADDGRELYAISSEFDQPAVRRHPWLREHVWSQLPIVKNWEGVRGVDRLDLDHPDVRPRAQIARLVHDFIVAAGPDVELWANWGAYDHVCLAQLWGPMIALPEGVPMFTHDIQQEARRLGIRWDELPKQEGGEHNALADARHNRTVRRWLATRAQERTA
ncbi:3'-5' exoribonuclease domain-containing protein [Streptomyces sp. ST2-7A]|uniref:3'-5' exoribonuclease domain-containing protein n=1 Tax=Streptomyces sp. ST2-7A TaxID=2907214 RepID=UPI001F2C5EB3|nr:3'-5' exoribonuclease [Streptomyces sp. ST2-7A]MCE7081145.1 3'-5' exoribonuclease [Streptomyces sp. ST2-7A]